MGGLFGQLRDELLGPDGSAWAGSVEDLLFDGESVRRTVSLGENRVVVTTHRLLAFRPTADGENYRQVDLPNVADVRAGHVGESHLVVQAGRMFIYGAVLLGVGLFLDFEAFVPMDAFDGTGEHAGELGLGELMGMMQSMLELLAMIDDLALAFGALLLLFGAFVVLVYLVTRDRVLVIGVAGDEPNITVPVGGEVDERDRDRIEGAVTELETELFEASAAVSSERGRGADTGFKSDDPL